jgi:hypothetical protein
MVNRWYNYENFILFIKENQNNDKVNPLNADGLYQYIKNLSEAIVSELNADEDFDIDKFYRSHVEKEYGLYRKVDSLIVDKYFLRHKAFSYKEKFMSSKSQLLVAELEKMFDVTAQYQRVTEFLETDMNHEAEEIQAELRKLEELQKLNNAQKRKAFPKAFSKDVHEALQWSEHVPLSQEFKESVPSDMYKAAVTISGIASYQQTKHLVSKVTKPSQTKSSSIALKSSLTIFCFKAIR